MWTGDFLSCFFLAVIRATGVMLLAPVFSGRAIPSPVKGVMTVFFGYLAALRLDPEKSSFDSLGSWVVYGMTELCVGLFMGWAVRLVSYSVDLAGQLISTELGFSLGQQLDPMTGSSSNAVGSLLFSFGSLVFLSSGSHQAVILAFLRSFSVVPLGVLRGSDGTAGHLIAATGSIFSLATQMAAPLVCINFLISMIFSVLGRAAPGMNVFAESFAVRILVGMLLLGLTLGLTAQIMVEHLERAPELMLRLMP